MGRGAREAPDQTRDLRTEFLAYERAAPAIGSPERP